MLKKFFSLYKIPLLIFVTLSIVLIAVRVVREPLDIALVILGVLIGIFVLDADYIIYAYFMEPEAEFSRNLTAFISHRDLGNAFNYIHYHKNEVQDRTLHSILFQIALAALTIFGVSASTSLFLRALIISTFTNSIYRLTELYFSGDYSGWFWALKVQPSRKKVALYLGALLLILIYSVYIF